MKEFFYADLFPGLYVRSCLGAYIRLGTKLDFDETIRYSSALYLNDRNADQRVSKARGE